MTLGMRLLKIENIKVRYSTVAVTMFAILSFMHVNFVGRFMASELLALVGILTFGTLKTTHQTPYLSKIILGYVILLFGLIVSDIYNESLPIDYMRGWAMVIFGTISTLFLTIQFVKNPYAIYIFLTVSIVAAIFLNIDDTIIIKNIEENSNYFKTRYVPIFLPSIAILASLLWRSKQFFTVIFVFSCGSIFLAYDARSSGAALIISALILFIQAANFNIRPVKLIFSGIISGLILYGSYVYYVNQVLYHGAGGPNAQQLNLLDNPYNPVALLLVGRVETLVVMEAIKDKPLLGFGSWGKDKTGEYWEMLNFLKSTKNLENPLGVIPKHSVVLGSWMWGGIIGFIGILLIGLTMLRMFFITFRVNFFLSPIISIYFVESIWHFLFSPIGHIRTSYPFVIALLLTAVYVVRNIKKDSQHVIGLNITRKSLEF